jgi:hypothetical protein
LAIARNLNDPSEGESIHGSQEEGQEKEEISRERSQVSSFPQARSPKAGLFFGPHGRLVGSVFM